MIDTDRFETTAARLFQESVSPAQLADALRREWCAGHSAGGQQNYTGRADYRVMAAERGLLIAKIQRRLAAARLRARVTRAAGPMLLATLRELVDALTKPDGMQYLGPWGRQYDVAVQMLVELRTAEREASARRKPRPDGRDDLGPDGTPGLADAAGSEQDQAPADA